MVQFFNRLGRFPNCALDNRTLAVGLAELIIEWEVSTAHLVRLALNPLQLDLISRPPQIHRRERLLNRKDISKDDEDDYTLASSMVDMVTNFLVRISLFTADHKVCEAVYFYEDAGREHLAHPNSPAALPQDPLVQRLSPRCISLLGTALKVWSPVQKHKFSYLEKLLSQSSVQPEEVDGQGNDLGEVRTQAQSPALTPAVLSTCLDVRLHLHVRLLVLA